MIRKSLLGTTTAELDSCKVRDPPFTGPYVEVSQLAQASYDDTALIQSISANATAIAGKRDTTDSYS